MADRVSTIPSASPMIRRYIWAGTSKGYLFELDAADGLRMTAVRKDAHHDKIITVTRR